MKKLIIILFALINIHVSAQDSKINIKDIFKFGTIYGAVNGGTSLSDQDAFSVTNGLQTSVVEDLRMELKIHLQMPQLLVDGITK